MDANVQRVALDALLRRVHQEVMGTWPPEGGDRLEGLQPSPRLVAAIAAAESAHDTGIAVDVDKALQELQAAWAAVAPAPARDAVADVVPAEPPVQSVDPDLEDGA